MAGKGTALQLCGDKDIILEKIFKLREEPPNDNYMFLFGIPFRTTVKRYKKDCSITIPGGKLFSLNTSLKKLDERGMHGFFSWDIPGTEYGGAGILECEGNTQFVAPSPGGNYNVHGNVTWQFGKVKPFVKIYQVTEKKDIDITNGEIDMLVGKEVKLKAVVLPYTDAGSGRWEGIPDSVITGFIANDNTGNVIKFKDYEKSEIEFFFVEGKPEGKKVILTYTADSGKVVGKTNFRVLAPEVITKELQPSRDITVGPFEDKCRFYLGKLTRVNPPAGTPGMLISHEVKLPMKFSGHPHLLQYVQRIKEEQLEHYDIDYFQKTNKEWCLDTHYPYGKMIPAPHKVEMNDSPNSIHLDLRTNEAHIQDQFETYLMFIPSDNPQDKNSVWVPLKFVEWGWGAVVRRTVDWRKNPPCNENTFKFLYKQYSKPIKKDCKKHPEWPCNVEENERNRIDEDMWKKSKSEQKK
jgi:hypothetical protein